MSSNSLKSVFEEDIDMVTNLIRAIFNLNNNLDKVRGRSLDASAYRPRSLSISLSENEKEYHVCICYKMRVWTDFG